MLTEIMDWCETEDQLKNWAVSNKDEFKKIPPKELKYFRFLYSKKMKELRDGKI
tara:strand:- start:2784 stop:2945 length:162 start_codon:yes stop_codon:yes gene_type:complete